MFKNVYEIIDEFNLQKSHGERLNVIRKYGNLAEWRQVLQGAFHPAIKFFLKEIPKKYTPNPAIKKGMADITMKQVMKKVYLFMLDNPRVPNIPYAKKEMILVQHLEGMEPREAEVFLGVLFKSLDVKYLTYELVKEAFPTLLPDKAPTPAPEAPIKVEPVIIASQTGVAPDTRFHAASTITIKKA